MGKLMTRLELQLKRPEHKKDAEDCIKIYNWIKDSDPEGKVWSSRWEPLVDVEFIGEYPYKRHYKPNATGQTLLKGTLTEEPKPSGYTHYEKTILENIDLEAYDIDTSWMENKHKIQEIYSLFVKEYVHHNNQHLSERVLFKEWLMGLPSVLTVPFYNHDIIKNAEKAGFEFMNEELEQAFLEAYWMNLSNAFFTLKDNL